MWKFPRFTRAGLTAFEERRRTISPVLAARIDDNLSRFILFRWKSWEEKDICDCHFVMSASVEERA